MATYLQGVSMLPALIECEIIAQCASACSYMELPSWTVLSGLLLFQSLESGLWLDKPPQENTYIVNVANAHVRFVFHFAMHFMMRADR